MAVVTFILKFPDSKKKSPIIMLYGCSNGRLRYFIGESAVTPWPQSANKGTKAKMNRIESHVEQLAIDYKVKNEPITKELLKSSLDKLLEKKKVTTSNMYGEMTEIVNKMETGQILTPDKKIYSPGSIKTYRFAVDLLQRFDESLTIETTTIETYKKFIVWMQGKDYSINYIGSQIKNWKTLGKAIGTNPIFNSKEFKKIQEETFDIYLDEKELAAIVNLKLNNRESVVRDWFILDCYTGLRVSDLVLLDKRNYSDGFIIIANEKTDQQVKIPANKYIKEIIKRYKGFPPVVTDVEINRVIKGVAKKAKITGKVLFTITKGGKRKDEYLEKWQMVSCHTSRRSFITNLLKNGVPDTIVMKLTGIRSAQTLKRYDKLSLDEAATIAAGHRFFK